MQFLLQQQIRLNRISSCRYRECVHDVLRLRARFPFDFARKRAYAMLVESAENSKTTVFVLLPACLLE